MTLVYPSHLSLSRVGKGNPEFTLVEIRVSVTLVRREWVW